MNEEVTLPIRSCQNHWWRLLVYTDARAATTIILERLKPRRIDKPTCCYEPVLLVLDIVFVTCTRSHCFRILVELEEGR